MKKRLLVSQQIFWIQIRLDNIQICSGSCADPENSVSLLASSRINVFHVLLKGEYRPLSLPPLSGSAHVESSCFHFDGIPDRRFTHFMFITNESHETRHSLIKNSYKMINYVRLAHVTYTRGL